MAPSITATSVPLLCHRGCLAGGHLFSHHGTTYTAWRLQSKVPKLLRAGLGLEPYYSMSGNRGPPRSRGSAKRLRMSTPSAGGMRSPGWTTRSTGSRPRGSARKWTPRYSRARRSYVSRRRRHKGVGIYRRKRSRTTYSSNRTGTVSSVPFNPLTGQGVPARLAIKTSVTVQKAYFYAYPAATVAAAMGVNTAGTEESAWFRLNCWRPNSASDYGACPVGQTRFYAFFPHYYVFACKLTVWCHIAPTVDGEVPHRLLLALYMPAHSAQDEPTTFRGWKDSGRLDWKLSKKAGDENSGRMMPSVKLTKYFAFKRNNVEFDSDKWNASHQGELASADANVVDPTTKFQAKVLTYDYDALHSPNPPSGSGSSVSFTAKWKYYAVLRGADQS